MYEKPTNSKQPFAANSVEFFYQLSNLRDYNRRNGITAPVYVYKIQGWREVQVGDHLAIRRDLAEQHTISGKPGKVLWMAKLDAVMNYMNDQGNF